MVYVQLFAAADAFFTDLAICVVWDGADAEQRDVSGLSLVTSFEYGSNGAGELSRVVFPYGGDIRWQYRDFEYVGGRRYREVHTRQT